MFWSEIKNHSENIRASVEGRKVLVIGGAGSIGSSFIKAILPFRPQSLVVVDINENGLAELTRDLRSTEDLYVPEDYLPYPMDFASPVFEKMFRARGGFDIVANFSAHKHVRSEKDIYSIEALIQNNLLHAKSLLDLLSEYPPKSYFCVSTDKATNPVNIMGASKRIMEDLIFSYSDRFPVKTARFANVAFSNGSLPAGFLARIEKLQPLSAPLDVRRYFVSPEESGQICLLACVLGKNREIFFPKLEEAVRMAKSLKTGSRLYPVHYAPSDTAGEKPFEEFVTEAEQTDMERFPSLGVITGKEIPSKKKLDELFRSLNRIFADQTTKEQVVEVLEDYLPNFEHIETGKNLDEKM